MKIEKLIINSFGMLVSRTYELKDGINLVEGENESGKSTLAAFIKFILYGFVKRTGQDKAAERARYINWKSGEASGAMILVHKDKRYKIERSVRLTSRSESGRESFRESLSVHDTETGASVFSDEIPGEVFLGVSAEVYENTAYIRQLGVTGVDGALVGDAIQNILFSADESINTGKACEKLNALRRTLLHKNEKGGAIYELTLEAARTEASLSRAKEESSAIIAKESEIAYDEAIIADCKEQLTRLTKKKEAYDLLEKLRRFESFAALKSRLESLVSAYEDFKSRNSHEGMLPTREYVKTLTELERTHIALTSEIYEREKEYNTLRYESTLDPRLDEVWRDITEAGGRDEVLSHYESLVASKKSMGLMAALFAAFGALGLKSSALVLAVMVPLASLGYVLLGVGVVCAAAAVGAFFARSKKKAAAAAYLSRFGVRKGESLSDVIARACENEAEGRRYREVLGVIESDLAQKRNEREKISETVKEKAALWGRECEDIHALITEAAEVSDRAEEMRLEIRRYTDPYERALAELADDNEEEIRRRLNSLGAEGVEDTNITMLTREIEYTTGRINTLIAHKIALEKELISLEATTENPAVLSTRLEEISHKLSELKKKHAATLMAEEAIMTASENLRAGVTPRLSEGARGIMERLTGGKYSDGGFSAAAGAFEISFESEGEYRGIESLSSGTQDAAYISLRLSLTHLLYRRGLPALILDESFAYLDDARTKRLLDILSCEDMQTVIFTCRDRERRLLSGCEYNHIKL